MLAATVGSEVSHDHDPSSLRSNARHSVAEKWARRRKQQQEQLVEQPVSAAATQNAPSTDSSQEKECPLPPLCVLLQRSWREAVKSFRRTSSRAAPAPPPPAPPSKRASFPSVLSALQANALKQQIESFQRSQEAHSQTSGADFDHQVLQRQPSLLKVLPTNYDFEKAAIEMSKRRSRVFWLLHLAAIVQAHVKCRKDCKLASGGTAKLLLAYRLHHNANPKLLQLLYRLGIALQVATKQICRCVDRNCRKLPVQMNSRASTMIQISSASPIPFIDN